MNFLAHLYLSGDNPQIKVGNFIGDWVKGKQYNDYPTDIRKGIILHRDIDTFTDAHPIVRQHTVLFRPEYGKFAGIVTDVLYDYLLATSWSTYSKVGLVEYALECYHILDVHASYLPDRVQYFLPFMKKSNRLASYATQEGIRESLTIMSQNTSLPQQTDFAMKVLNQNIEQMQHDFTLFFAELRLFIHQKYDVVT